jgi:hypothetical protein
MVFYQDLDNKNGVDWLRFSQSSTCPKFIFKIHTIPLWPVGLLLGEDNIILQKLSRYYEVYNKNVENMIGRHICPKIILKSDLL